mmetsp:Transcript_46627/g.86936  ORF Transcript_46627/g.86936 Transcript_46627/m.86936 type:complete len:633 (-) Transcript_46627:19-1917(-)
MELTERPESPDEEMYKGLSFSERWELIGSRFDAPPQIKRLEPFCRMSVSQRLLGAGREATAGNSRVQQDTRRQRPLSHMEAGSPLRYLVKSASTGRCSSGQSSDRVPTPAQILARPDHIGNVFRGLEQMRGRFTDDSGRLNMPKRSIRGSLLRLKLSELDAFVQNSGRTSSSKESQRKQEEQERLVVLSGFKQWCVEKFQVEENAFLALSEQAKSEMCIDEQEFLAALKRLEYPADKNKQQVLFGYLASKEEGNTISIDDFNFVLENVWAGNINPLQPDSEHDPEELNMDPFEAACLTKSGSVARTKAQIFGRLRKSDPPIAELLEFMFAAFGTLRMAFRQMDINGNGMLSTQEFADCMRDMRSKTGERPVESHMQNLFDHLQQDCGGMVTLEKMVQLLDSTDDPMLLRLVKFITEIRKKGLGDTSKLPDDAGTMTHFMRIFQVAHRGGEISREHFCKTLSNLRYHEWHAVELFRRLDVDGSGNLTVGEFTAFLEQDPVKKEFKGPLEPMGSEYRRQQVENGHISCNQSYKLAHIGTNRKSMAAHSQEPSSPHSAFLNSGWSRSSGGTTFKRPIDWVECVRSNTQRRYDTELSRKGAHVFQTCHEPMQDLCDLGAGLEKFDDKKVRCRITAF